MTRVRKICQGVAPVIATVIAIAISSVATPAMAAVPTFEVGEGRMSVTQGDVTGATEIPCTPETWAGDETRFYGACSNGGLLVVDVTTPAQPEALEVVAFDAPVTRVFRLRGEIWFELKNGAARPLAPVSVEDPGADPDSEPESDEPESDEPETGQDAAQDSEETEDRKAEPAPGSGANDDFQPVSATILEVEADHVVLDKGAAAGVQEGDRFFLLVSETRSVAGEEVERERQLGVGTVTTVTDTRAELELPLNVVVPEGAFARQTKRMASQNRMAPEEVRGVSELNLNVRPFLALGTLGGGAVIDAGYSYRFEAPIAIDVKLTPLAFGVARDGDILTFAGNAIVSYDTRFFQVGLGAGVSQINDADEFFIPESEGEPDTTRLGFSAAQFIRLGVPDGLNVEVVNNFVLVNEEFEFGGIDITATIPTSSLLNKTWLTVRGGGGVPGYVFGEVGIRVLAVGNGGPGSIFLLPTVGFVLLDREGYRACEDIRTPGGSTPEPGFCSTVQTEYGGPMVGFGVDWRF